MLKLKINQTMAAYGLALAALLFSTLTQAEERILSFQSDIRIHLDGSMDITETIRVRAEGRKIKHGIYRDFPTVYEGRGGGRHQVGFEVLEVELDGQEEPWHSKEQDNGMRVYIGSVERYVKGAGEMTYRLHYRTDRQLGFFSDHDELYWNVTGNGWSFPIDEVTATVSLPKAIPSAQLTLEGYTGSQGSKAQHFTTKYGALGAPTWQTNAPLGAQEGLTIVLSWPKGYVNEPGSWQKVKWLVGDYLSFLGGLAVLILAFIAYYRSWSKVGRDPERGVLVAQYAPPQGLSAAAVSYLVNMRFGNSGLSAAIIELAVKGVHKISEPGSKHLHLERNKQATPELNDEEMVLLDSLYQGADSTDIKKGKHRLIRDTKDAVGGALKEQYFGSHFSRNGRQLVPGLLVSIFGLLMVAIKSDAAAGGVVAAFFPALFIASIWVVLFVYKRSALKQKLVLFVLGIFLIVMGVLLTTHLGFWFLLVFITAVIMSVVFAGLLRAYTPAGRQLMDEIEGFKLYLSTAEQDRMNLLNPPERTPELFEKYLPYALVLEVENQWAEQFNDVLAMASTGSDTYSPGWYSGRNWDVAKPVAFAGAIGAGLATTISSASVAPGTRSGGGGGGGGFSGGGGGGGGGGGW